MSISSNGTWIYVADKEQQQEPESYIGATAPRRPMAIPVSPKELDRQQEILDYYNNKKKLEKLNEALGGAGQPSGVTQSRLVRHLRSMPSFPKHGGHHRDITVSSTGATLGPCYPETQVQTPTPPPVASRRRKNTSIPPPVPNPLWVPFRSATEPPPPPLHSHPSRGLLNVNTIVDSSPSKLSPSASPYSAPISSSPTFLPLSSLPPGYDFALAQFRPEANKLRPLRLLSLDGGGVRGISSLKILKDIMDRIKPGARPCDYFDLIAGTSTGGLIAIMLGRLRMSVDECILYYHRLAKQIFKRNPAAQAGSLAFVEHRFSPDNLEEAIRQVVARWSPSNTKMADHHRHCARTFVVAVRKHNVNNHAARRIRTYATQHCPADTCEIWEAGRATSAAPSYFPPLKLKDEHGQLRSYIDGGLGYNNPSKELLNEARDVFGPEHTIGCFLSIGTGVDRNTGFQDVRRLNSAYDAFKAIALNSEQAHRELNEYFSRTPGVYFRFNAGARLVGPNGDEDFAKQVALEDWHKMDQIESLTSQYLKEEGSLRSLKRCAERLNRIAREHR
ncbi:Calcium-independent phospholipase A2-gamma OS=Oryctolagus cuniculus GN=PNPLA8 PE=1 SV=1 [Rhizoctonia solani AG-1 IB]|uniref:Calcium-independent phospholipase A2-gamma n=1 Tax=Thanatephorus cucumeris (strain AG1-IB / isolate 7/3/14) TaxID=1108050 RepID=A0A0B7FDL1_THACB|nr:Calcium-independent phospholipase A2-gamma OS=Oryctolagus cuniculus GN=PNPLA8 PE=1 SV=1 [Rhizoctonia solani AG-1 IB]